MISPKEWFIEKMMERTVKALSSNYFDAHSFTNRESLINSIMQYATPGSKIGIGGSLSVRGIGLIERLSDQNTQVLDHWKQGLTKEEISAIRLSQLTCDLKG